MKVTKKTRLLAKPGPVINSVYSEGHKGEPDKLFDGPNVHVLGSNLNLANGLRIRFYATNGDAFVAFFDEDYAIGKADGHWTYKGDWIYERMRNVCMVSGLELDLNRGGSIELASDEETMAARFVVFDA